VVSVNNPERSYHIFYQVCWQMQLCWGFRCRLLELIACRRQLTASFALGCWDFVKTCNQHHASQLKPNSTHLTHIAPQPRFSKPTALGHSIGVQGVHSEWVAALMSAEC
jgi:hypothetical protein